MAGELPDDDAGGDGNIHGMLGTELGYLEASVAGVDNLLMNAFHLVAEDDGERSPRLTLILIKGWIESGGQMLERGAAFTLFDGINVTVLTMQLFNGFEGGGEITPLDAVFTAESSLVNLRMGRRSGDTTEIDRLHTESVGSTEYTADIVHGADIVENNDKGELGGCTELVDRQAVHFYGSEFAHVLGDGC